MNSKRKIMTNYDKKYNMPHSFIHSFQDVCSQLFLFYVSLAIKYGSGQFENTFSVFIIMTSQVHMDSIVLCWGVIDLHVSSRTTFLQYTLHLLAIKHGKVNSFSECLMLPEKLSKDYISFKGSTKIAN